MDGAAHVLSEAERRLLVGEGDEPDRAFGLELGEPPRQLEQSGYAAGVVVRPGAAAHRVVVRPDQQDLVGQPATGTVAIRLAQAWPSTTYASRRARSPAPATGGDVVRRRGEGLSAAACRSPMLPASIATCARSRASIARVSILIIALPTDFYAP